jgi:hypothetical protein
VSIPSGWSSPPDLQTGRGFDDLVKNRMGIRVDPKQDMEKLRDFEAPVSIFIFRYKGLGFCDAGGELLLRQTRALSSLNQALQNGWVLGRFHFQAPPVLAQHENAESCIGIIPKMNVNPTVLG